MLKKSSVLIIDDDTDVLTAVRLLLKTEVKEVVIEKNPDAIKTLLPKKDFDLILLDMNFNSSINTGNEGIFWLKKIKEIYLHTKPSFVHLLHSPILLVNSLTDFQVHRPNKIFY